MKRIIAIVLCCVAVLVVSIGIIIGIDLNQVVPVIMKFEKKKAEEITALKEKMPGYIFDADNRAGSVTYLFLLHNTTEKTVEKFVKQHNLKSRFPNAEVKASYGVVTLKFKRDDYTKAVHYALNKLSKKSSVRSASASVYSASNIKYKPDISLYAKNPTKLEYTVNVAQNFGGSDMPTSNDNNITDVNRILTTKKEYDAFIDLFAAEYNYEVSSDVNQHFKDKYGEEFFKTNALLVTKEITRGDLGYGLSVDNVYLSDKKIYVVIRTDRSPSEYYVPTALLEKTFYLTVSKDAIKGATELITLD